jgi:hypothetical protein
MSLAADAAQQPHASDPASLEGDLVRGLIDALAAGRADTATRRAATAYGRHARERGASVHNTIVALLTLVQMHTPARLSRHERAQLATRVAHWARRAYAQDD